MEALDKAEAALLRGDAGQAYQLFAKSVDVTPDMCHKLMVVLRQEGIRFVVAPYEADAQLAYLWQAGTIQGVITEDSDTIPYGCDNVLYKMDKAGNGQLFRRSALGSVPAGKVNPLLPSDMSDEQVRCCAPSPPPRSNDALFVFAAAVLVHSVRV